MSGLSLNSRVRLNNGVKMPLLGLGTWGLIGERCLRAVGDALTIGYRLFDTASIYGNEEEVGEAIRVSGVPRKGVFVTTKVGGRDQGYEGTLAACDRSLGRLGMDYIDLYLIHWPVPELSLATWKGMERLLDEGKCRAIGVSNYAITDLEEILRNASVVPAVDQIELSPYRYERELIRFCQDHGVQVEAYSPLTRGERLKDHELVDMGHAYSKSPAQILIRWALQKGAVVIPKSSNVDRIRENADVFDFEIHEGDMAKLSALSTASCMIDCACQ